MSEKEKRIVEKLKNAIPNMSEFDKGYILGKTESFSEKKYPTELLTRLAGLFAALRPGRRPSELKPAAPRGRSSELHISEGTAQTLARSTAVPFASIPRSPSARR